MKPSVNMKNVEKRIVYAKERRCSFILLIKVFGWNSSFQILHKCDRSCPMENIQLCMIRWLWVLHTFSSISSSHWRFHSSDEFGAYHTLITVYICCYPLKHGVNLCTTEQQISCKCTLSGLRSRSQTFCYDFLLNLVGKGGYRFPLHNVTKTFAYWTHPGPVMAWGPVLNASIRNIICIYRLAEL